MNRLSLRLLSICVSINLSAINVYAENLGQIGKTYPIEEPNLIDHIKSQASRAVANGSWKKMQQKIIKQTEQKIDYPPVILASKTVESSIRYYDPSIKINQDIINPFDHTILANKGQVVNPSDYMPFNNELIFIDGRDPEQVSYALMESKRSPFRSSIVLTAANKFRELQVQKKHLFYYDQNGKLVSQFGIKHVPTIIYQDNIQPRKLRIEEVKL